MEICREATTQLLNLVDAFANGSRPLKQILPIFEALCDLIQDFESLFCDSHTVCLVKEAVTIKNRLKEAISISYKKQRNLSFHNNEVELDDGPTGGVSLITIRVMDLIYFCCQSRKNLEPILQEYLKGADGAGAWSSFSEEMVSLLERLERKLRIISKSCKDPALRYFSMINNRRFIKNMIKEWDLGTHLSDEWIQNNLAKIQQNLELYHRSSWNKVLDHLNLEESLTSNVAAETMIERLILFNTHFTEMCTVQSTWYVFDKQLRKEIITSLENMVLPAYGNFIGRFLDALPTNASEYIMYGMFDIEAKLKALFRPWWKYIET